MAVGYTWNSELIDGTDILHSILAIGTELDFLFDINLNTMPKLAQNKANTTLYYLKLTDSSRNSSSSILKTLIEDLRITHDERIINFRNLVVLHAGDIVMVRTSIQSDFSKHKVAKLSYSIRGSFRIIHSIAFDSYFVRKLNKPDSSELKSIAYDLCPLLPSLKPYESINSTYTHYLNQMYVPLINLLKKTLDIE